MNYYDMNTQEVLSQLDTSMNGLTDGEAESRLSRYGKNEITEQKKKGVAVLFIGEDLDVLLELSDKIMVLCHGKNMGIVHADKTTKEELGLMMTGSLDLTEEKKEKNFGIAKDSNLTEEQWEKVKEEEAAENE